MLNNDERPFLDAEEVVNDAISRMGKDVKIADSQEGPDIDERIAALTVQELLEELKTDEFEKIYINSAAQINTPSMEGIPDEQVAEIKTVAEYRLSNMAPTQEIDGEEQERIKSAANFYMIPRMADRKVSVGKDTYSQKVNFYTITDPEGCSLYTVINENNITLTSNARNAIQKYLEENYPAEFASGLITVDDIAEKYTPKNLDELYQITGEDHPFTIRFLPERVDEIAVEKGIDVKTIGAKDPRAIERDEATDRDDLDEDTKVTKREDPEFKLDEEEKGELEEPDGRDGLVDEGKGIRLDLEEEREENEQANGGTLAEKIARNNHVKPAVVNIRVIENFEKVEEDTGIPLKGRYPRGEVVAVRIPYKLGYRTFLAEKSTGLTIDGRGIKDTRNGKLYNFREMEDYFRFKIRDGDDGGENGKPLRADEGKDYTTYINEHGELDKEKFVNNGKEPDMIREERERYLAEVEEVDRKLKDAIEEYQDHGTRENYLKVKELIDKKVEIDNKYNALDEQREVTEKTKENTEDAIGRDLDDDDDDWFPGPGGRHHW